VCSAPRARSDTTSARSLCRLTSCASSPSPARSASAQIFLPHPPPPWGPFRPFTPSLSLTDRCAGHMPVEANLLQPNGPRDLKHGRLVPAVLQACVPCLTGQDATMQYIRNDGKPLRRGTTKEKERIEQESKSRAENACRSNWSLCAGPRCAMSCSGGGAEWPACAQRSRSQARSCPCEHATSLLDRTL